MPWRRRKMAAAMFDPHAPTLFLSAALTSLVAASLMFWQRRRMEGPDILGPWAAFAASFAAGNAGFAQAHGFLLDAGTVGTMGPGTPGVLLHIVATPALNLLAFGLLWLGVRRIGGCTLPAWAILLAPTAWVLLALLALLTALEPSPAAGVVLHLALLLGLMGAAARDAWRACRGRRRDAAFDVFVVLAVGCLWVAFRLVQAISQPLTPFSANTALLNVMLGTALPFLGITLAREASARREAAAAQAGRAEVERLLTGLPAVIFQREVRPDETSRPLFRAGNTQAVTGMDPAALAGHPDWTTLAVPGTFDQREALRRTLGEGHYVHEWALRRPDSSILWLRTEQRLLSRRPDGSAEIVGYHLNITAEREAAAELEQTLTAVPAIVHRGVVTRTGRYTRTWLSRGVEGVTGWPWEAVNPQGGLQGLIHSDDQAATVAQLLAVLRDGRAEAEYRLLHAEGHFIWVRSSMVVLQYLPDGAAEVIAFLADISAARAAREREAAALLAGREQVERLHAGLPALIFLREVRADGSSVPLYRGGDLETVTGWAADAPGATEGLGEWGDGGAESFEAFMRQVLEQGSAVAEHAVVQPDGRQRWIRARCRLLSPLVDGRAEVAGYMLDVTAERLADARAASASRLAALGEMAAGLAHELRQPLTALSLAAENAQMDTRGLGHHALDRRLDLIVNQAHRASEIIETLRRFARGPEAGARQVPLDLHEVTATLLALVGGNLREARVTLSLSLGVPPPVPLGDKIALEQILMNLVINARDAVVARDGARHVRISAAQEGDEVVLTVSDNGGGLPPAILARAFEPFVTTKGPDRGTGLGLSICYGLVRVMGGRITVANGAEGAIFTITLPAAPGQAS